MKKIRKILVRGIAGIIIVLLIFSLSGCYSVQSIDDLTYVIALGIDKGKNNTLALTVQFTFPTSSESASGEAAPTIVNTVECASINSGITLLNSYTSKEINLSHCKIIVFSEELAVSGIGEEIFTLSNQVEIRPDSNIIISKSTAKEYIENSKPELENLVAKYYELNLFSQEYAGFTENISISNFFNKLNTTSIEPTAILGNGNKLNLPSSNNSKDELDIVAGELPITEYERESENLGIAVFKDDKMVGELTAIETMLHLILTNNFESGIITLNHPLKENSTIDIALYSHKKTNIDAKLINGSPFATIEVFLNSRLLSVDKNSGDFDADEIKELESLINSYLENAILNYLYKTSKEFESDIDGIGQSLLTKFKNSKEWNNYNWPQNYKNTFFKAHVNTNIKSSFLLSS